MEGLVVIVVGALLFAVLVDLARLDERLAAWRRRRTRR